MINKNFIVNQNGGVLVFNTLLLESACFVPENFKAVTPPLAKDTQEVG